MALTELKFYFPIKDQQYRGHKRLHCQGGRGSGPNFFQTSSHPQKNLNSHPIIPEFKKKKSFFLKNK
jgi:hypothetical protein